MYSVYDQLFNHEHLEKDLSVCFQNPAEIQSFLHKQRSHFNKLITSERLLVSNAQLEPSFCWFQNRFCSFHYNLIVEEQIDIFRMLHNIDTAVS
jgi:hypothetical protein